MSISKNGVNSHRFPRSGELQMLRGVWYYEVANIMKTHMNVMRLALLFGVVGMALRLLAGTNLLVNADFASEDGRVPDGWSALRGAHRQAYVTKNGELAIRNTTGAYANWVSQSVAIDADKTYYFEAEMLADALSSGVSVVYSVADGAKRKVVADYPIVRNYPGPLRSWTKFAAVIPIPAGADARRLSVGFILYNAARRAGVEERVAFRHPVLCEYAGQKPIVLPKPESKLLQTLPDHPFPDNFTGEPVGSAYRLERGGVGFLRLNSGIMPRREIVVEVKVPEGVETELYLMRRGAGGALANVRPASRGRFVVGPEYDWLTWGNALLFRSSSAALNAFDIDLSVSAGGKTVRFAVPVRVFDGPGETRLPRLRRFNSWQAFPVTRIDVDNPSNVLGRALSDYWKSAGWRHGPFVEINGALPGRVTAGIRKLAEGENRLCDQAVDAKGAPIGAWCDTDWVSRDISHFVKRLRDCGFEKRLLAARYVMNDFEPYNEGPVTKGCFCDRCRAAFAAEKGLVSVPTGLEILARHKPDWIGFRCRQRAAVARKGVEAVKAINPDAKFLLCTMPGDPGTDPEWMLKYGIDLSLYADFTDIYTTMNYSQGLDFFRSLEDECRNLRRESRMFVSGGWGSENVPKRTALQLLTALFAGVDYPFLGQGLYISQNDQVAAIRAAMDFVARTEGQWGEARYSADKLELTPGFRSEDSVYSLERRGADGTRHVLVFNNSERETAYAHLAVPGEGDVVLALAPLSWRYLPLTDAARGQRKAESETAAAAERAAREAYERMFESRTANGMSTSSTPDAFVVKTPAQSVRFDLLRNAEVTWYVGGKVRGEMIGRDHLTTDGLFAVPGKGDGKVEASEIGETSAVITVSYRIATAPYDGLVVRRRYTIARDRPGFDVAVEVVPEGGYRMFRLRTGVNCRFAAEMPSLTDVASVYRCGTETDSGLKHVAFVREGARFPDGKPFLVERYVKNPLPLAAETCTVESVADACTFSCRADGPDEIFGWRDRKSASVEFIFADAYDHYDPHAIKTWRTSYSVELSNGIGGLH